ncbi:fulicin peptides-like [Biomphalaria glabrata]|uniref:Fulicin peptides-like n=1 Tax=Biomphalaria glabrata TaxID=6526 RepID=A0A9W3A4F7_BIOGL|nr:fulicin peptides-like [Biomphalaria glabrata]
MCLEICVAVCSFTDASVKAQTKRTARSPNALYGSNTADSRTDEDGLVAPLDTKNHYSESSLPRFSGFADNMDSGELLDKQEGGTFLNQGNEAFSSDSAESSQKPTAAKRFNEFVGKRSNPTGANVDSDLARELLQRYKSSHKNSDDQHALKQLTLLRSLTADDTSKRQYEFVGKRNYDFLGKRAPYDFIGKRAQYEFIGKRAYDFLGKRHYDFLGKRSGSNEKGREDEEQDGGKRYSEFLGRRKRTEEQGSALMTDSARLAALLQNNSLRKRISEMLMKQRLAEQVPEFVGK